MPRLLRHLRKKNRWQSDEPLLWLEEGDIPADPLDNLSTLQNKLSVFEVNDDLSRIERVAAAMATRKELIQEFDYIVFDQELLEEIGIAINLVGGDTPDNKANSWHRDLIQLSATKLVELAKRLVPTTEPDQILPKRIREVLINIVASGEIDWNQVNLKNEHGRAEIETEIERLRALRQQKS